MQFRQIYFAIQKKRRENLTQILMINTQLDGSGKIICVPTICLATIKTFMKMNKNISSPINKCMFKTWSPLYSRTFWRWMGGGGGFCYTDWRQLRHRHHLLPLSVLLKVWSPPSRFVPNSQFAPPQSTGPLTFYQIFSTNKFPLNIFQQIFFPNKLSTEYFPRLFHQNVSSFLYNIC